LTQPGNPVPRYQRVRIDLLDELFADCFTICRSRRSNTKAVHQTAVFGDDVGRKTQELVEQLPASDLFQLPGVSPQVEQAPLVLYCLKPRPQATQQIGTEESNMGQSIARTPVAMPKPIPCVNRARVRVQLQARRHEVSIHPGTTTEVHDGSGVLKAGLFDHGSVRPRELPARIAETGH